MKNLILVDEIANIYNLDLNCRIYESQKARHSRLMISRQDGLRVVLPKRAWNKKVILTDLLNNRQLWVMKQWQKIQKSKHLSLALEDIIIDGQKLTAAAAKEVAKVRIVASVAEIADRHDLRYNQIKIKNQKRSWGTCHRNGNLSFNWRIILLPSPLYLYVIYHELAHLKVFSHSKNFWGELEKICPDAKSRRKELKRYEY